MALIKCSECGKQISSNAKACPHCGNPMNISKKSSKEGSNDIASTTFLVAFICLVISIFINPFGLLGIIAIICSVISILHTKNHTGLLVFNILVLIASFAISVFYISNMINSMNEVNSILNKY